MTRVCSCPAVVWQRHQDTTPHRLARLSRRSNLSLGKARHQSGQAREMVPPASPSSGAAQLCTFCPLGPRAPGKPMEPFSPCSPLVPCKQKLRSAQGRRESFSHCMATAQPWSPPRPGLAALLAPCPWCLLAPAHRAQGCHHALLPLSIALSTALHDPQPSSSQPGTSFPQPCTFSPSMPCSPLSPLSPSVPFRPRSPCKGGNTGRGQGMRRSSDTHEGGEDRPRWGQEHGGL